MTKHTSNPDPKLSISIPLPDRSVAGIEAALEQASLIMSERRTISAEIMDKIGPRLGEWALAALAIHPARTTTDALTKAVMARWTIDRLFRFPGRPDHDERALLATALYDDVIRVLQAEAGVTVEDLGVSGYWNERTSVLGKVAAVLVESVAKDETDQAVSVPADRSWAGMGVTVDRIRDHDVQMTALGVRDWALRSMALQPAATAKEALLRAVAGYAEFMSTDTGAWAADALRIETEQLVLVLLDEVIRFLQVASGKNVEALGLGRFWTEEGSLMGRIEKAAGTAD